MADYRFHIEQEIHGNGTIIGINDVGLWTEAFIAEQIRGARTEIETHEFVPTCLEIFACFHCTDEFIGFQDVNDFMYLGEVEEKVGPPITRTQPVFGAELGEMPTKRRGIAFFIEIGFFAPPVCRDV